LEVVSGCDYVSELDLAGDGFSFCDDCAWLDEAGSHVGIAAGEVDVFNKDHVFASRAGKSAIE
jgi:hypothetical protein